MPLDVSQYSTPVNTFQWLYKVSDDIRQDASRKNELSVRKDAQKRSNATILNSYVNPKDFFTGTNHDPVITDGVHQLLQKGFELASMDGMDGNLLMATLAPEVARLSKSSENIKAIERQRKETEERLKGVKGIDLEKFNNEFKRTAYLDANGKLKDLSDIDPNKIYGDEVLRGGEVYTDEAIDDFLAKAGKNTTKEKLKVQNSLGGFHQSEMDITKPDFMISDTDADGKHLGFVPKYDIATDGDAVIMHTFKDENGKDVKAPVRMVKQEVWDALPKTGKAFALQETRRYIKNHPEIKITDPQAENFAKAIAYDELKNSGKKWSTYKPSTIIKENPAPRISVHVNNKTGAEVPMVDIFTSIKKKIDDHKYTYITQNGVKVQGAVPFNILDDNEQEVVMKKAKVSLGNDITGEDIYLKPEGGYVWIMDANTNKAVSKLSKIGTNVSANQSLGVKSKQRAVNEAQTTKPKMDDAAYEEFLKKNGLKK